MYSGRVMRWSTTPRITAASVGEVPSQSILVLLRWDITDQTILEKLGPFLLLWFHLPLFWAVPLTMLINTLLYLWYRVTPPIMHLSNWARHRALKPELCSHLRIPLTCCPNSSSRTAASTASTVSALWRWCASRCRDKVNKDKKNAHWAA